MKKLLLAASSVLVLAFASFTDQGSAKSQVSPERGSICEISHEGASLCGKCGDGYCAKQCGETARSCPADCGGVAL